MATTLELALMAGQAYESTRKEINWFPTSTSWVTDKHDTDDSSGFEAISFVKEGTTLKTSPEIVISYAGTYDKDISGDIAADVGLAAGTGSAQLLQAVEYYLQVKAANPGATITLTGHSLGGGLASLVAVFFGVNATTFDQGPFAQTALFGATALKNYLVGKLYTVDDLAPLTSYIEQKAAFGAPATLIPNEGLVRNIIVQGEMLSVPPGNIPRRIGATSTADTISNTATGASSGDLHSQALLSAFLQSQQSAAASGNPTHTLNKVTDKLPDLLKLMFDPLLFAHRTDEANDDDHKNLIEHLVRHEAGMGTALPADAMVTRFTKDLWKLAQDSGMTVKDGSSESNWVNRTLIAFAMQKYYEEKITSAG